MTARSADGTCRRPQLRPGAHVATFWSSSVHVRAVYGAHEAKSAERAVPSAVFLPRLCSSGLIEVRLGSGEAEVASTKPSGRLDPTLGPTLATQTREKSGRHSNARRQVELALLHQGARLAGALVKRQEFAQLGRASREVARLRLFMQLRAEKCPQGGAA